MRLRTSYKGKMQGMGQFQVLPKASLTAQQRRVFTAQGGGGRNCWSNYGGYRCDRRRRSA